jgi:hypothetical protein
MTTMTNSHLHFAVYCVGSNKLLAADLAIRLDSKNVLESSYELQRRVNRLADTKLHQRIKVMLGSPAGPQLTPPLRSLDALIETRDPYFEHDPLRKATKTAWSKLQFGKVHTVYATQHKPVSVVVDELVAAYANRCYGYGYDNRRVKEMYDDLPQSLRCHPAVFVCAHTLSPRRTLVVPDELRSNKMFALGCFKRRSKSLCFIDLIDFKGLRDDEEVVIAAVASEPRDFQWASPRLQANKAFVLKAVGVNGLCINWVAPELKRDKDVALAAVRQNKHAVKYLCAELQEDRDVVAACANNE